MKSACAELANLALGGRLQPMSLSSASPSVVREQIGDVQVQYSDQGASQSDTYSYVRMILRGLGGFRSTATGMNKLIRS